MKASATTLKEIKKNLKRKQLKRWWPFLLYKGVHLENLSINKPKWLIRENLNLIKERDSLWGKNIKREEH